MLRALPKITPPSRLQIFPISDFSSVKNLSLQLLLHLKIFSVRKNRILEKFETESGEVIFGRALNTGVNPVSLDSSPIVDTFTSFDFLPHGQLWILIIFLTVTSFLHGCTSFVVSIFLIPVNPTLQNDRRGGGVVVVPRAAEFSCLRARPKFRFEMHGNFRCVF